MNIFLLTETESGCYKWRGAVPAKYLARRGHTVQIFSGNPTAHDAPDVMMFFRAHFVEAVKLVGFCKKSGIRVVFDTDDALDLVPRENVNYASLQARLPVYDFMLRAADVVTTTTETLAEYLRRWNRNVVVLPNSVDPEEWEVAPRSAETRVGWTGSATHFEDLTVALDAVREAQKKHAFKFVLQGICNHPTIEEFSQVIDVQWGKAQWATPLGKAVRRFLDKLSEIRYEFHPNVPVHAHARKVCELALDIGIAPLTDHRFNYHKSCIKYYEYAMSGAVTIASHVLPYSTEVPNTAKNRRESWKEKLEYALSTDRAPILQAERDWVLANRNMEKNVELWERVLTGDSAARGSAAELQSAVG
jgi:phenylpyruvate tautomerase PptA (4-oxalocrotonate tautomerase family)